MGVIKNDDTILEAVEKNDESTFDTIKENEKKSPSICDRGDENVVSQQYDTNPYPPRIPEQENDRLIRTTMDYLPMVMHYCFRGDLERCKKNFRVLIAGGGTGDGTIFLAEQLRNLGGEVVHIDIANRSMKIAKQRAKIRNLKNIRWEHCSIYDLLDMKSSLGAFDYIECSGCLHHLNNPEKGLEILRDMLVDDGAMGIMIYGAYGRQAVYPMQRVLKIINDHTGAKTFSDKIDNAREVLRCLPHSNVFQIQRSFGGWIDIKEYGDSGVYDLLLHAQDQAYTVPGVYNLVEAAKLQFVAFAGDSGSSIKYNPTSYLNDEDSSQLVASMSVRKQQEVAELLSGSIIKHTFYVSKSDESTIATCDFFDDDAIDKWIPQLVEATAESLSKYLASNNGKKLLIEKYDGIERFIDVNDEMIAIASKLDNSRTIKQIVDEVSNELHKDRESVKGVFKKFFEEYNKSAALFLSQKTN